MPSGFDDSLPRSLYAPQIDPRADLRQMVDSVFSDKFMIALSVIIIPILLTPYFFTLSRAEQSFLNIIDWVIVILFVAEYCLKLYLAQNRWQHFKSPWHIVDLIIITIPFIQLTNVFELGITGHPSLLLRLLTVPRVFAVGGRATIGRRAKETPSPAAQEQPETIIMQVGPDLKLNSNLTWETLKTHLSNQTLPEWIDISNISNEGFAQLSQLLSIPESYFQSDFIDDIFPHIDYLEPVSLIYLQSGKIRYPNDSASYLTISRSGVIMIYNHVKLITVSKHKINLLTGKMERLPKDRLEKNFSSAALYAVLMGFLNDYQMLLSEIEVEVIKIGGLPKSKLPKDFLERMFRFGKETSRVVSNLVHFKEMLGLINRGNLFVKKIDPKEVQAFNVLQDTATYLNEIADNVSGNMQQIIDLYINQTSFDTNRILKVLAVITALAVVPSSIGGLLGMNMLDVPFQAFLWQIVTAVAVIVLFMGYACVKLGWLKT
jgi:Mg2+ and Co2+ transporter CorA